MNNILVLLADKHILRLWSNYWKTCKCSCDIITCNIKRKFLLHYDIFNSVKIYEQQRQYISRLAVRYPHFIAQEVTFVTFCSDSIMITNGVLDPSKFIHGVKDVIWYYFRWRHVKFLLPNYLKITIISVGLLILRGFDSDNKRNNFQDNFLNFSLV